MSRSFSPSPSREEQLARDEQAALDRLTDLLATTRQAIASFQAFEVTIMATASRIADAQSARLDAKGREHEMAMRSIAAEFASAVRVSDRTMQRQIDGARSLADRFPATLQAFTEGRISKAHAQVIHDAGAHIEDDQARAEYEAAVIERAQKQTPGRLTPTARGLAERSRSTSFTERHRVARQQRSVRVIDLDDGMSELLALLPSTLAHGIHDRLTRMVNAADAAPAHDGAASVDASRSPAGQSSTGQSVHESDPRSLDEKRADAFADLLLCGAPTAVEDPGGSTPSHTVRSDEGLSAIRAHVQVVVPVLSLLDSSEASHGSAMLDGRAPIDLETARALLGDASGWDRVLTDPIKGSVLAVDRYRPSEELRRHLKARDVHCRFPGCRLPARRCDVDHTVDHALGGETIAENLAHLCRRHHSLKHASAWKVRHVGRGSLEWTSPSGRTYVDSPVGGVVAFQPDG